jgi:hypothetical protein
MALRIDDDGEKHAADKRKEESAITRILCRREVVAGLIHGTAEFLSTAGNPRGCLSVQGALACGTDAEPVKQAIINWRKSGEAALKKRLQQAQSEGELPPEIQPADFARYLSSVIAGLGVQAAYGATRAELRRVAEIALRCTETGLSPTGKR